MEERGGHKLLPTQEHGAVHKNLTPETRVVEVHLPFLKGKRQMVM